MNRVKSVPSGPPGQRPGMAPHAVPRPFRNRFRPPMLIADSYLLQLVIGGTLRGLCWFAGLLFAFAVISAVRRVVAEQLPLGLTAKLVACQFPRIFLFTLPMSVLFGTVQTFSDLSTRGELTALSVGGMSLPRMVRAPLLWGLFLAILAFWLQEAVVPKAERRYKTIISESVLDVAGTQKDFVLVDRSTDNRIKRIIQADYFDSKSRTLGNPSIQIYNENREVSVAIRALSARWDVQNGLWIFYDGTTTLTPDARKGGTVSLPIVTTFTQTSIDVVPNPDAMGKKLLDINEHLDKRNYEMLSISDLAAYLSKQPALLDAADNDVRKEKIRERISSLIYGIQDKIATPLVCIVVILIGAPLGVRPQRSGGGFAMGLSLAALLVYYIVWSWASQLGKAGFGNPYLMAYLPIGLTLVIGLVLMKLKSR